MDLAEKRKSWIEKIKKNKYAPYFFIVLFGIIIMTPLFTVDISELNEFRLHIDRVTFIKETIEDGIFPPFLSYKNMMGFGYALNIFYGPLTTYIPILISYLVGSTSLALKVFTVLTVILSGIMMYKFTYRVTERKIAGFISALVYMAGPYKFTDIYSRNAVGEYTAFIFIPMVFLGLYELMNSNYKIGNRWLIIGASLLVLSHTITTIYTALLCAIFVILNYNKFKKIEIWKNIGKDLIAILLLTSFYTIPLIEHKMASEYLIYNAESMRATGPWVYYNSNSIADWFKSELSHDELVFSFGLAITFLMAITIFCYKKIDRKYKETYTELWILSIISLFMASKAFPWQIMPHVLTIIQFAWRMNGFFLFFIATICGINALVFSNILYRIKGTVLTLIICVICTMAVFGSLKYWNNSGTNHEKEFENYLIKADIIDPYGVNRDYLPLRAMNNLTYVQERKNCTYAIKGSANIESENKNKLSDKVVLSNVENASLELPFLYYTGFTIKLNGNTIDYYESENGFVCVDINEKGELQIDYTGTTIEYIALIIPVLYLICCYLKFRLT